METKNPANLSFEDLLCVDLCKVVYAYGYEKPSYP